MSNIESSCAESAAVTSLRYKEVIASFPQTLTLETIFNSTDLQESLETIYDPYIYVCIRILSLEMK